ncbi:nuclear transport factor 2 family protein [Intrasporangium sp. YIM S08009]|uniref:nuclear transport factor 2 family protein n=1 Tax=Intrasporangium zincisolvens TaxID=3080018 RepID=UPI002B05A253|nr:nuclear transport factor 2 family protein [Intrasporangium sp. YIM S08009]
MTTTRPAAHAPEDLEALLAAAVASADLDAVAALHAPDAVVSLPHGREAAGRDAVRSAYAAALDAGALVDTALGAASTRAVVSGTLAMTTSTWPDGTVRTQVARREADGTWVWTRDGSRLRDVDACLPVAGHDASVA